MYLVKYFRHNIETIIYLYMHPVDIFQNIDFIYFGCSFLDVNDTSVCSLIQKTNINNSCC